MKNACSRWSFLAVPVLAALGCSDPVPLPAQGAISLQVGGPSSTCPVPGNVYPVGRLVNKVVQAPSDSDPGQSVIDGESGTTVSCSVHGGGPYTFSGSIHATSADEAKDPITVDFTNGVVNADKATGSVTVSVFTPQLLAQFTSGAMPCTVKVINHQIKGGSIWADFSCPTLSAGLQGTCSSGVAPSTSTVVFENCDGS